MGSGQFGTPWERIHALNLTTALSVCCDAAPVEVPPFGSRCAQVLSAAANCELLTPSSWKATLGNPLGKTLPLMGSGYFGTPLERMQRE